MEYNYYSILSHFQENTAADLSCIISDIVWYWVEKMFQDHQRRSMLRALRVSINTVVWMVMWIYPEIQAQLGI